MTQPENPKPCPTCGAALHWGPDTLIGPSAVCEAGHLFAVKDIRPCSGPCQLASRITWGMTFGYDVLPNAIGEVNEHNGIEYFCQHQVTPKQAPRPAFEAIR